MVKLSISYEIYFGEYLWIFVSKMFTMHEPSTGSIIAIFNTCSLWLITRVVQIDRAINW